MQTPVARASVAATEATPVARLGIVADVQYVDRDDGWDFARTQRRRYRNTLVALRNAVQAWQGEGVSVVLQLGDLIDGYNASDGTSDKAMESVWAIMDALKPAQWHHLVGNHELYCYSRSSLMCALRCEGLSAAGSASPAHYYGFDVAPGFRCLVLDAYAFCTLQDETRDAAIAFLGQHNPNDVTSNNVNWAADLPEHKLRFLPYNGAFGHQQLQWLDAELAQASAGGQRVIVTSHVPLTAESSCSKTVVWDAPEALAIMQRHTVAQTSNSVVVAAFAGHRHQGGYAWDAARGMHHVTVQSPLVIPEAATVNAAHGTLVVWPDRLELHGQGIVRSRSMPFDQQGDNPLREEC